jgi:hypothetical protein
MEEIFHTEFKKLRLDGSAIWREGVPESALHFERRNYYCLRQLIKIFIH